MASNATAVDPAAPVALDGFQMDARVAKLYDVAKQWTKGRPVTAGTIISFTTYLISAIEQLVTESHEGAYKKQVVLGVLHKVVENDIPFETAEDRQAVLDVVDLVVPVFIDTIIGVATGSIDIGKIFESCKSCCMGSKSSAAAPPAGPVVSL